jgi:hypothetical protein
LVTTPRQRRRQRGDTAADNVDGAQKPREHPAIFQKLSGANPAGNFTV